jgi:isopenicillin N synthase-like dioxygenase
LSISIPRISSQLYHARFNHGSDQRRQQRQPHNPRTHLPLQERTPLTPPQLVDFSLFLHGSPDQRLAAAAAILHGFQTAGFVYLSSHSIPAPVLSTVFASSAAFFRRPLDQKDALGWTTPRANRGYVAHGREKVSALPSKEEVARLKAQAPDLKESFEIGREGEPGMPNNWPSGDAEADVFRETMIAFHDRCKMLHVEVMRAIAVGMGLDEGYFDSFTDVGDNTLRLLHYPSVPKDVFKKNKMQVRAGEHTDYGSITLLFQDDRGGLQVKSPSGTFVDATPIPGTVVVNAGDMLARWSNDTIKSTTHRVVEPPSPGDGDVHPARYSVAYFCNPNFSSQIQAIDGTYGGEKGERKYADISSRDYLVQRLAVTY